MTCSWFVMDMILLKQPDNSKKHAQPGVKRQSLINLAHLSVIFLTEVNEYIKNKTADFTHCTIIHTNGIFEFLRIMKVVLNYAFDTWMIKVYRFDATTESINDESYRSDNKWSNNVDGSYSSS